MVHNFSYYIDKLRNSTFRHIFWPVRSHEFIKFFPIAFLMFTVLLNQNIVRDIKDSLVITLIGPEIISFIKLWVEMPLGIIFIVIYTKICNVTTTEKAFRYIVCFFLSYFFLFGFVIFPNLDFIHPRNSLVQKYIDSYVHLKWFIILWSKWSIVLFYVMGELWPVIICNLLFWQLANKITKTEEAKRFYSFFSLFGQSNLLISGSIIMYFTSQNHIFFGLFHNSSCKTEITLKSLALIILITGIALLSLHRFIEYKILTDPKNFLSKITPSTIKINVLDSLKMIVSSKYLCLICIICISYSMSVNLIEGLWFSKVKEMYPIPEHFMRYQGKVIFYTGIVTLILCVVGSSIVRYGGWLWGAITTPLSILIAGGAFFTCVLLQNHLEVFFNFLGVNSLLAVIVFIGGVQNVLGKGAKYALFDATKEMTYIPLNTEMKTKGKIAVDMIGAKVGKSSGALFQFLIFTIFPQTTFNDIAGVLMTLFIIICSIWIFSINQLSNEYSKALLTYSDT